MFDLHEHETFRAAYLRPMSACGNALAPAQETERDQTIVEMFLRGSTAGQIAEKVGTTEHGVRIRAVKLGLRFSTRHIRPGGVGAKIAARIGA
jgi:DNA-binding NarL/FixJ family response regulator